MESVEVMANATDVARHLGVDRRTAKKRLATWALNYVEIVKWKKHKRFIGYVDFKDLRPAILKDLKLYN